MKSTFSLYGLTVCSPSSFVKNGLLSRNVFTIPPLEVNTSPMRSILLFGNFVFNNAESSVFVDALEYVIGNVSSFAELANNCASFTSVSINNTFLYTLELIGYTNDKGIISILISLFDDIYILNVLIFIL